MDKRFSKAIFAILAAAFIACGSRAGSAGSGSVRGGGDAYLTANENYGVQRAVDTSGGAQGSLASPIGGPELQP